MKTPPGTISFLKPPPAWIQADPRWPKLRGPVRWVFVLLFSRCDHQRPHDEHGSVAGAFAGQSLYEVSGLSKATVERAIGQLHDAGFLVTVSRGGVLPSGEKTASVFGVPGRRGALDRVARERRTNPAGRGGSPPERWVGKILPPPEQCLKMSHCSGPPAHSDSF